MLRSNAEYFRIDASPLWCMTVMHCSRIIYDGCYNFAVQHKNEHVADEMVIFPPILNHVMYHIVAGLL